MTNAGASKVQSINPATGERIAEFDAAPSEAATDSVQRARAAQRKWWALAETDRIEAVTALGAMLESRKDEIVATISSEAGRTAADAEAEVLDVVDAVGYYVQRLTAQRPAQIELNEEYFPDTTISTRYFPQGVIAMIMPWNFPFYVPMMNTIPALLAGNAVVIKPSEYATMVGAKIVEVALDSGLPKDLVQYLPGADDTGRALIDAGPDKIFFVGSAETGRAIIQRAGTIPVQVEMGGNSAAIVLEDADLKLAARAIAWAGLYSSGQDCVGIKRVYVRSECALDFEKELVAVASALAPGRDYGPYIRPEARAEVLARVQEAVDAGSTLVLGPSALDRGFFATPTIIRLQTDDLTLTRRETFGNVLPIMTVSSDDEAIVRCNDTTYGLSSCVFTSDPKRADRFLNELESGMVFVNDPFVNLPGGDHWTGWKNSGFGTVESKLEQMQRKKVVSTNWSSEARAFWY